MNNRIKLISKLLLGGTIVIGLTSCSGDEEIKDDIETVEDTTSVSKTAETVQTYYQIPSPDEMFSFIRQGGLSFKKELLNDIKNVNNYQTPKAQALNFGVYSADLAYTAAFEEYQHSMKYFAGVQKLAEQIGISGAFDQKIVERIKNNLNNPDSLVAITNDSYFSIIEYLEQNEQSDKLGMIAAAGWLETTYIVSNLVTYKEGSDAVQRIADQKVTLENVMDYLNNHKDNNDVNEFINQLAPIKAAFDAIESSDSEESSGISFKKKDNGKMVLGGGKNISITKEQFEAIKKAIAEVRNNITQSNA